jgi:hypothetical protein
MTSILNTLYTSSELLMGNGPSIFFVFYTYP